MRTGRMLLLVSVGVLGLTSWLTRDAAWWAPLRQSLQQVGAQGERALAAAAPAAPPRKCVSAAGVLYTTDPACPPGSREQAASGGTLTVVAAPAKAPASAASAQPLLRQLADPEGSAALQSKRMEKAVGP